jgi:peptidoglycan/xylan/chitin deacetylase (PgdA/CDA1 family)
VWAGRTLRPNAWPYQARCAVALSFDCDHETSELREGGKSIGRLSWGQYGSRAGMPRVLDVLRKHGVPASFFVPAVTALLHPEEAQRIIGDGHEIGLHGWIHELNSVLPHEAERDLLLRYDSSLMADVDCYELLEAGVPSGLVELPVEWIRDDDAYLIMNRFEAVRPYTSPADVYDIFRREFDAAYAEGGVFQLTMHPHVTGYRSRIWILEEIIRYTQSFPGVWFATHRDVAEWALEHA